MRLEKARAMKRDRSVVGIDARIIRVKTHASYAKCFLVDAAVSPRAQQLKPQASVRERTTDTAISCWKHLGLCVIGLAFCWVS